METGCLYTDFRGVYARRISSTNQEHILATRVASRYPPLAITQDRRELWFRLEGRVKLDDFARLTDITRPEQRRPLRTNSIDTPGRHYLV